MTSISFFCKGDPRAKGSRSAFPVGKPFTRRNRRTGREYLTMSVAMAPAGDREKEWAKAVNTAAKQARHDFQLREPMTGAVQITTTFYIARPKHHMGTGRNAGTVKEAYRHLVWHTSDPDSDKLVRNVMDALKGVLYADDAQVAVIHAGKVWELPGSQGVAIQVESIGHERPASRWNESAPRENVLENVSV